MESLETIKNRIQSITSTRQITQSMRLVSTSKVQKARTRMEANRPFLLETERLAIIAAENFSETRHPYLRRRESNRAAVIVISGDRGLCGGYNMGANRHAAALIKSLGGEARIVTIGIKARDFCRRRYRQSLERSFTGISENPFLDDVKEIAALVQGWYDAGDIDNIYVVYTKFESMLAHTPAHKLLLPLDAETARNDPGPKGPVHCEPGDGVFLEQAVSLYITACLFGAILESSCCEHAARLTSMDSAVKNADDMIEDLTLQYNQARQGAITQELIEIVGGADAV